MAVRHTIRARLDFLDIWEYIAARNRGAADRVYQRLEDRIKILDTFPEAGVERPEIAPGARVLSAAPYLIFYRIIEQDVQIVRVLHGARRIHPDNVRIGRMTVSHRSVAAAG